ncbi:uncharacterized membrane protein YidH (DUF202 family) [Hamadaea flava]|uniref:DUF4153 domain-containing protein n=1 Tax=Hamadaea flava TaxID=1742688 RepID=A0ABV8LFP8_9ACTN|nr:DUF4173 domain-containing protein [Hamadaea flava]MCP2326154.1 uncharacterized membrane protein YidH (DUF202 family) [Hamadaea flava]
MSETPEQPLPPEEPTPSTPDAAEASTAEPPAAEPPTPPAKRARPAKKAAADADPSAAAPAAKKATPAKKAAPAKKATPAKAAPAKKATPAKKAALAKAVAAAAEPVETAEAAATAESATTAETAAVTAEATAQPVVPAQPAAQQPAPQQPVAQQPAAPQPVQQPGAQQPGAQQPVFAVPPQAPPGFPQQVPTGYPQQGPPYPPVPPAGYWTNPPGYAPRTPPPGFTQTRWPGPRHPAPALALLGILLGGLGFALALPLSKPGIGWPIAGLAAALGVGYAAWRSDAEVSRNDRIMRLVWGLAALALLTMSAIRASGLLTFYFVIGALACASLAAAGGKSVRAMLFGVVAAPIAGFRSIPWVAQSLAGMAARRAERRRAAGQEGDAAAASARSRRNANVMLSAVITLVLLLIFGALFASADAVFAHYLEAFFSRIGNVIPDWDAGNLILRIFLLCVGLLLAAGGVFLASNPPDLRGMESPGRPLFGRDLLALPLAALALLFVGFVAVQFTALFGGNTYILEHAQVTYAKYAVGGFRQLVVVSLLTLVIVAAAARWGHKEQRRERLTLRVLLGTLCVLSIVIVVSALTRLQLYVDTYGLTRERFAVAMLELFLGISFLLVLLAGWKMKAPWLSRAVLGIWVVMLLGAAALNPEHYIAQHNIERYQAGEKIDLWYLGALSADAVPALVNLPESARNCVLGDIDRDLREDKDDWYEWNWSREQARHLLAERYPAGFGPCQGRRGYDYQR